jgi:predicted metal-dependent HD superfamily phosphohydrolase
MKAPNLNLMSRWIQTWKLLRLKYQDQIHQIPDLHPDQIELFNLLAVAYSDKTRHHHTMDLHLRECFEFYDSLPHLPGKSARTEMALWFHDYIYSMKSGVQNEKKSAKWCKYLLMDVGVSEDLATQISNLILADHSTVLTDPEEQLLSDVDLWILASPSTRFKEYEAQIRMEYQEVPDYVFYPARRRIMKHFAEKEHIYYMSEIRLLLEDRAKSNLSIYAGT